MTRANNQPLIEEELTQHPFPSLHFVYFDLPTWARWWKRGQSGMRLYYYLWQIGAYIAARRLHAEVRFHIAHHVTFVKYWAPSLISFLPIPFVWGPVGGGDSTPRAFRRSLGWRGRIYEIVRCAARWLGEQDPLLRLTANRTGVALATTGETAQRLQRLGVRDVRQLSEAGLSDADIRRCGRPTFPGNDRPRFVSIGRLLAWKGFHLGLQAFAEADLKDSEYWIIGDGPERRRLELLSCSLGINKQVRFCGKLPRDKTIEQLKKCHVLVHPSLHDSGGWVCLEAMAAGRPVVCLDLAGPATQVTDKTGVKIAAGTPNEAIGSLASTMKELARDVQLRANKGQAGRMRVEKHYRWNQKADQIRSVYEDAVASQHLSRPLMNRHGIP
jgi:glycosyltransferase involved in cell wall biosynthesis